MSCRILVTNKDQIIKIYQQCLLMKQLQVFKVVHNFDTDDCKTVKFNGVWSQRVPVQFEIFLNSYVTNEGSFQYLDTLAKAKTPLAFRSIVMDKLNDLASDNRIYMPYWSP